MANRVNVLLSRAKHGMFLVGNTATLTAEPKGNIWPRVIDTLTERGQVGAIYTHTYMHT
jgi:superfamily I DNA and/or RNA helicase